MARIMKVISTKIERFRRAPGKAIVAKIKDFSNGAREKEVYAPAGIRSRPTKDDRAVMLPVGSGVGVVIAAHNYRITVEPKEGETIIYATDAKGEETRARVELKNDGTLKLYSTSNSGKDAQAQINLGKDGLLSFSNQQADLTAILKGLIDELIQFRTAGSPTNHVTDPATIANLEVIKQELALVLTEAD